MTRLLPRWIPVAPIGPLVVALMTILMVAPFGIAHGAEGDEAGFRHLADEFIDQYYFVFNPSIATSEGVHRFDDRLEDYSRAGIERDVRALQGYEQRLAAIDAAQLSQQSAGDRELLLSYVRSSLLTLQTIRPWEKNPDFYSSGIGNSAYVIMEREYAPANERLRALIARERQMPAVLQAARHNLTDPPRIFTQIALEQLPGIESLFAHDVPAAFAAADDPQLKAQFAQANARVVKSLQDYQSWLKHDLLPRSKGDFRIGAKAFSDKLRYDEMVDTPLDRLLEIGTDDLHRNQAEFARVGGQLAPGKTPQEVLAQLTRNHPAADQLLDAVQADFAAQLQFIRDHRIISVPAEPLPKVIETPPFMRAMTQASLDPPGAFETTAAQSYFNVTLPDPSWSADRVDDYLRGFNYPLDSNLSVHEAFPGHFFQFANLRHLDDRVRQLFYANTNVEGWAHYCEQMMLDEGFSMPVPGSSDAQAPQLLRMSQLVDALLRDARFIVGIKMHTGQMTFDQAVDFFVTEGYQPREIGLVEAKRGTADPTYLYYTLGKLEILKLRADVQAREGQAFRLQEFHDRFMQQGAPPIRIVRRAMLQDDSPTL
ncbi:MAG TPA: DUF885 domain-containing protein [Steroidobacteraceae bacterium]|jgi:uncharacterized protein (DUF885 family)|nr:DUF885 domain-containing protein [Steroidobacteraceae bacterium]